MEHRRSDGLTARELLSATLSECLHLLPHHREQIRQSLFSMSVGGYNHTTVRQIPRRKQYEHITNMNT
jgi:hypothetical protein